MERKKEKGLKNRYALIDTIRGLALVSMIGYHGAWNLVYLYGMDWKWYQGREAFFWQQSICWTFILLSGFCWSMGRRQLKNGITVFLSGLLVRLDHVLHQHGIAAESGGIWGTDLYRLLQLTAVFAASVSGSFPTDTGGRAQLSFLYPYLQDQQRMAANRFFFTI